VSSVENMSNMFQYCSISILDVSGWDTSNVLFMSYMFYNCTSLTSNMPASKFWNNPSVTSYTNCFRNCTNVPNFYTEIPTTWDGGYVVPTTTTTTLAPTTTTTTLAPTTTTTTLTPTTTTTTLAPTTTTTTTTTSN